MPDDPPEPTVLPANVHAAYAEWHAIVTAALLGEARVVEHLIARASSPRQLLMAAATEMGDMVRKACEPHAADPNLFWRVTCEQYLSRTRAAPPPPVDPPR